MLDIVKFIRPKPVQQSVTLTLGEDSLAGLNPQSSRLVGTYRLLRKQIRVEL